MVASRKIYPQIVWVNFDLIPSRSMARNKLFVGSIFSGLFLPRNLRTEGLKNLISSAGPALNVPYCTQSTPGNLNPL